MSFGLIGKNNLGYIVDNMKYSNNYYNVVI